MACRLPVIPCTDPHDLGLAKEILRLRAENIVQCVQCAKSGDLDSPSRVMTALR